MICRRELGSSAAATQIRAAEVASVVTTSAAPSSSPRSGRRWTPAVLLLGLLAAAPAAAVEGPTLHGLERIPSLEGRIRAIETFVDRRYYDAAGMMYSHSNWREERPFVAGDFQPQDSTIAGPEPHAWLS